MAPKSSASEVGRIAKHTSIYAIGNISRQLVGFIMLPIYTRFLTPADYGVVGLMTFAISLIEPLFGARLGQSVPKFYYDTQDKPKQAKVVSTALIITSAVSVITTIILVLFRKPSSEVIFGTAGYGSVVGFFSVLIFTQAIENYALIYIRIQKRPWLFIGVNLAKLVVQLSLNIWLVVVQEMAVMGVAISAMASSTFFACLLLFYTIRHVGWRIDSDLAIKMLRFSWPLWLAGLAMLYINSSNRYFLRIFGTLDDVGVFELAFRLSMVITLLVWQPFSQFWEVERFRYYHNDNARMIFQNVFTVISTILIIAALGISAFGEPVIHLMAAPAFHRATFAVPFLVFGLVFQSLTFFFNFSFLVKERNKWITTNNYLAAVLVTVFYIALIPIAGYVGAALAFMLTKIGHFLFAYQSSRKFYDMKISLKPLAYYFFVAGIGCWFTNNFALPSNLYVDLLIKISVFTVASIAILFPLIRNRDLRIEAKRLIYALMPHFKSQKLAFPKNQ